MPIISIKDLKQIINDPDITSLREIKINKLKAKLDNVIEDECWDLDNILLEHNYSDSTVFD